MVLTEFDISTAYLHEEWALTFLKQLFSSTFTILFIGYSHDDAVMQLFARGMSLKSPEDQRRFALTMNQNGYEQPWNNRGITPIAYPPDENSGHSNLAQGIEKLAEHITRQPSQWKQRIAEIAERPLPPTDLEEQDTIKEAIRDSEGMLHFFTEAATNPNWLDWLNRNHYLDKLFQQGTTDLTDRSLADWMAKSFTTGNPNPMLELIGSYNSNLNPYLWQRIAEAIADRKPSEDSPNTIRKWVSLLLNTAPAGNPDILFDGLDYVSKICLQKSLTDSLVSCFGQMCQMTLTPQPIIRPRSGTTQAEDQTDPDTLALLQEEWDLFNKQPPVELGTTCTHYLLQKTWNNMKSFLDGITLPVLEETVRQLTIRHQTMLQWDTSAQAIRIDSTRRPEITKSPSAPDTHGVNAIIDAARDCLKWLAEKDPSTAHQWCNRLIQAEPILLKRLATYTVCLIDSDQLTNDQKIDWLIENQVIIDPTNQPEAYYATEKVLPGSSETAKEKLIEEIKRTPPEPTEES